MGLPIVQEIYDGLRWIIDFFWSKAPRPLQIIIFLLMLLLFSNVIIGMLHLIGLHCNQAKEPVTVSFFDVGTNVWVFYDTVIAKRFDTPNVSFSDMHPYLKFTLGAFSENDCILFLTNKTGTLTFCDAMNDTTCKYYYREEPLREGLLFTNGCVICNYSNIGNVYAPQRVTNWLPVGYLCTDDAYPLNHSTGVFYSFFNCNAQCKIPQHYKFDINTGDYDCIDLDYCGANRTQEPEYHFQELLNNADAKLLYTTKEQNVIEVKCTADFNPRPTLLGLDIFDYKIWVLLLIIGGMVLFLTHLGQQSQLKR